PVTSRRASTGPNRRHTQAVKATSVVRRSGPHNRSRPALIIASVSEASDQRGEGTDKGSVGPSRPRLRRRDVAVLIWRTYKASFPYVLLFVLVLLVVTWLLTELIFG